MLPQLRTYTGETRTMHGLQTGVWLVLQLAALVHVTLASSAPQTGLLNIRVPLADVAIDVAILQRKAQLIGLTSSTSTTETTPCPATAPVVLIALGGSPPVRPSADTPPISVQGQVHAGTAAVVAAGLNALAHALEAWLDRPLHALDIDFVDLAVHPSTWQSSGGAYGQQAPNPASRAAPHAWRPGDAAHPRLLTQPQWQPLQQREEEGLGEHQPAAAAAAASCELHPWAVWQVASGRLLVHAPLFTNSKRPGLAQGAQAATLRQQEALAAAVGQLMLQLASRLSKASHHTLRHLMEAFPAAVAPAVAAALAAAPPVWYCIACPIVLGLLAPLVINYGLAALAQQVCDHFSMDATECFDLWVGALAVGFFLSLLASVPIFKLCRLQECTQRGTGVNAS